METCLNTVDDPSVVAISSDERKYINRIRILEKQYPDLIRIAEYPEDNDGCIVAYFPKKWLKINPPRVTSEETRAAASQRLRILREKRSNSSSADEDEDFID